MFARTLSGCTLAMALLIPEPTLAQAERFKLGTFEMDGEARIGIVIRESRIIDLNMANASLQRRHLTWVELPMPRDMKELIGRYEYGLKKRIHEIVMAVSAALDDAVDLAYVHDLSSLTVLPPVRPAVILATALNYPPHAEEMTTGEAAEMSDASALDDSAVSMPHLWERRPGDDRQNPYLFLKPSSIVIAHRQPIRIKPKRSQIDWECEFALVVGPPASHVPIGEAPNHIFGYTLMNDVGDREGRGDNRYGSDWLVWKSSDTFAPLGPFIVPREFVADPHDLDIQFRLSGEIMQDSNTRHMSHDVYELLHFASNNLTLQPGDIIATGTPGGVGMARNPPLYMKPGDLASCWVDGIGSLENPIELWSDGKPY